MNISDFKQQNPDYKDVPDVELADALHAKYYSEIPRADFLKTVGLAGDQSNHFTQAEPRDKYQKEFLAMNPQAGQGAVDAAMIQYDSAAQQRTTSGSSRVQDKFKEMASPDAAFNARLNQKLQGDRDGVVPQLPGKMQPDQAAAAAPEQSTLKTIGANMIGGAMSGLAGAAAAGSSLVGADETARGFDAARSAIEARQQEYGGDSILGKASSLVGAIAPVLSVPADAVPQIIANAGLFAVPAFRDTYKAQMAQGRSEPLALAHAAEAFGINLFMPTVAAHGMGAVAGKLGTDVMMGAKGAAAGLGQAAAEGVGFSAINSIADKGTDVLAGQKNDREWLDPKDMAAQALGFGALRAGHRIIGGEPVHNQIAGEIGGIDFDHSHNDAAARDQLNPESYDPAMVSPQQTVKPIIASARPTPADIASAPTVDEAIAAANASVQSINPEVLRADNDTTVSDLLQTIRPFEPVPPAEVNHGHDATDLQPGGGVGRGTEDSGTGMVDSAIADPIPGQTGADRPADTVLSDAAAGTDLPGANGSSDAKPALTTRVADWRDKVARQEARLQEQIAIANENAARRAAERDAVRQQEAMPKVADAGTPIDKDWHAFPDNSGTLGIPRAEMPQIKSEHRGALTQYLAARSITHDPSAEYAPESFKPTQQEFSPAKVDQANSHEGSDRSILVSADNHVLDGHHQWLAKMEKGEPVNAIRLNAPIKDLLGHVAEFPSAEVADGATKAAESPGAEILSQQKFAPEHGKVFVVDPPTLGDGAGGKAISSDRARAIQALGKALGKDVHFYSQDGAKTRLDGFAPQGHPDALFVNAHAGDAGWHYVAGHEFFHQMPKEIQQHFVDAVKPLIKPEAFDKLKSYINQPHLDHEGVWGEIGADLFGNRFGEKGFFDKLAADMPDRGTAARVFDYIQKFIDKVSTALTGKQFRTDLHVDDLGKVREAAADALSRYLAGRGMAEGTIGGKRIADMSDKDLARFAKVEGLAGERARAEVERRAHVEKELTPAQRKQNLIDGLTDKTPKQLREIAANHPRAYLRDAAAEQLLHRAEATRANRSDAMKKRMRAERSIDENTDSMATAIAKLGGINRDSAEGRMRLAPEELEAKGKIGNLARNLFVKDKGVRMDEMGQMLAELGYVDRDQNGKHDQTDFEDKLAQVAGGEEIHTPQGIMNRADARRAAEMEEIGARNESEFSEIEHHADQIDDWAEAHDIDLSHIETMYPESKLIHEDDLHENLQEADQAADRPETGYDTSTSAREGSEDAGRAPAFSLEGQDRATLTAKDARANDQNIADRDLADSQRDAFSLTSPDGSVTGEANAMSNKRQQALLSHERTEKIPGEDVHKETDAVQSDAEEKDTGADIPISFFKKTKVPHDVWIADEGQYETVNLPAHKALASVREDIDNLKSLLGCLKG